MGIVTVALIKQLTIQNNPHLISTLNDVTNRITNAAKKGIFHIIINNDLDEKIIELLIMNGYTVEQTNNGTIIRW